MRSSNRVWWVVLAVAAVVIVVSAVIVVVHVTRPSSTQSEPPPSALTPKTAAGAVDTTSGTPTKPPITDVLPDAQQVDSLVGIAGLVESGSLNEPSPSTSDHPECGGLFEPGTAAAYATSGSTSMTVKSFRLPNYQHADAVVEAVAQFPDATAATAFVAAEQEKWRACERTLITTQPGGQEFFAGTVTVLDGVLLAGAQPNPGRYGWDCQRALTAADDGVADVKVCNFGGSDKADALATHIANRVRTR